MSNLNSWFELTKVISFLNRLESVNCGGCGIAALSMYRSLKEKNLLKGDEHFVFLYTSTNKFYRTNEKYFNNQTDQPCASSHVAFYYNGKLLDSNGIVYPSQYQYIHERVDEDTLIKAINNVGTWNTDFYRPDVIPKIEQNLNISLEDIK